VRLKAGPARARIVGIRPELVFAAAIVESVFLEWGVPPNECVVTSGTDSEHKASSRHYIGMALDFGTARLTDTIHVVLEVLREQLGDDFSVLLEDEGTPNEHIHVELRPLVGLNLTSNRPG